MQMHSFCIAPYSFKNLPSVNGSFLNTHLEMLSELHVPFLWGNFFLLAPKGIVIMMGVFSFSKNWVIARRFLNSLELSYLCHFV